MDKCCHGEIMDTVQQLRRHCGLKACITACVPSFTRLPADAVRKRINSTRLPHFSKLTTPKTKQFCETSSFFELDNTLYQCVLRFFHSTCLKYCACHEKLMPGHAKCCTAALATQNHLSKPLQNATSLRKSAP